MEEEINNTKQLKTFIKSYGITIKQMMEILEINKPKFYRWADPNNPNHKVLIYACKYVLRVMLEKGEILPADIKPKRNAYTEYRLMKEKAQI